MNQIQEAYVNFEIAKLLNEKGFDIDECEVHYDPENHNDYEITQQMAMRWLREIHNLSIEPYAAAYRYGFTISKADTGSCIGNENTLNIHDYDEIETYEEACEAAIKYCLKNLI